MWYVAFLVLAFDLTNGVFGADLFVTSNAGPIQGVAAEGYSKYLGIPYGLVNESNPFGPSIAHPVFTQKFEATDGSITCPQSQNGIGSGTIQCLTLNIFVPSNANSTNPMPVMVWIHGGAFIAGSAADANNPTSLLNHDVVVVAINYRLGIYGFMCLDIPEVPGNQGLKDQILALKWIKQNIGAFGGDVSKITIFGESAGGMSVNLHLFSSYEKLFDRVIIESGPALSYWMMVESDKKIPLRLAAALGSNTLDINTALAYLSTVDANRLVVKANELKITSDMGTDQPLTKPCVEKEFERVENFMTQHPMNIKSPKANTSEIIIGHNNKEFAFQYFLQNPDFFNTYDIDVLFRLGFDMNNDLDDALDAVRHFYFGDEKISESLKENLVDFGTDFIFGHSTQRMAEKLLDSGAKAVYRYVFSYSGSRNAINNMTGASHADELPYLFDENKAGAETTTVDQLVIDRMTKLWTNFAKFGNPTPESDTVLLPFQWKPITDRTQEYLSMDSDFKPGSRPDHERMTFWDLFYKLYGKYQKWYPVPKEVPKLEESTFITKILDFFMNLVSVFAKKIIVNVDE